MQPTSPNRGAAQGGLLHDGFVQPAVPPEGGEGPVPPGGAPGPPPHPAGGGPMPGPQVTPCPEQSWPEQPRAAANKITLANAIEFKRFTDHLANEVQPSKVMLLTLAVTANLAVGMSMHVPVCFEGICLVRSLRVMLGSGSNLSQKATSQT